MAHHATYAGRPAADDPGYGGEPLFTYEECRDMNIAFAHALLNARDAGLEVFTIGPDTTPCTDRPRYIPAEPRISLMTSSAAAIVDAPDPQALPTRFMPSLAPMPGPRPGRAR